MKKGYKFYFLNDASEKTIEALFKTEDDGYQWGKNYSLEYFKHEPHYMSDEIYNSL